MARVLSVSGLRFVSSSKSPRTALRRIAFFRDFRRRSHAQPPQQRDRRAPALQRVLQEKALHQDRQRSHLRLTVIARPSPVSETVEDISSTQRSMSHSRSSSANRRLIARTPSAAYRATLFSVWRRNVLVDRRVGVVRDAECGGGKHDSVLLQECTGPPTRSVSEAAIPFASLTLRVRVGFALMCPRRKRHASFTGRGRSSDRCGLQFR